MDAYTNSKGTPRGGDLDVPEVMELYGKRLENEHALISTRTGWLLTLDAFLIATVGLSILNKGDVAPRLALGVVLVVAVIGALSNASCLFSNYWAGRAIDEASLQVSTELRTRMAGFAAPGDGAGTTGDELTSEELELWLSRLRLYGRDPRDEPERAGFWAPPSVFLHPWYLIPTTLVLVFCGMAPMFLWYDEKVTLPVWIPALPVLTVVLFFGGGLLADLAYHARREGLTWREFRELRGLRKKERRQQVAERREERGRVNRMKLKGQTAQHSG